MFEVSGNAVIAICAVISALGIIGTFWGKFSARLTAAQAKAEVATTKAESAAVAAIANGLEIARLQRDFSEYQVKAAGSFVTSNELSAVEHRIEASVVEIRSAINGVNSRLDRVLDGRETGHA